MEPTDTFSSRHRRRRERDEDELFSPDEHAYYQAMRSTPDEVVADGSPPAGDRWSTWDQSEPLQRGPKPWPEWVITDSGAVDYELGVVKTGKEADVFLIERTVPETDRSSLLAAKRYRSAEHTMFNRTGDYTAGRTVRRSRDQRALAKRTSYGLAEAATRWAAAEFDALSRLFEVGVDVPYPVQVHGTEVIMEYLGVGRTAAPRLADHRPGRLELESLWEQACSNLRIMVDNGYTHGDLSPYNVVVHEDRLVLLDLPQIVDIYANPKGFDFLVRDVENLGSWFTARGLDRDLVDRLIADLLGLAGVQ